MSEKDGGQAFPSLEIYESYSRERDGYEVKSDTAPGMALRDYFAAKALPETMRKWSPDVAAAMAYSQADLMLKAREAK